MIVAVADLEVALEQIDHRQVAGGLAVGDGRGVQDQPLLDPTRLRYVFEAQQGLSFARNAGIAHARAPLVAFTDDDIRVAPDWLSSIQKAFDTHADVDCVGGRILPEWSAPPPRWLTRNAWVGALALQDYGQERFIVDRANPLCLAGANLSFRKDVFDEIGGFSTEFGSRSEDTELMTRFWSSGRRAMYVPEVAVSAPVSEDRMTKAYFRAWHVRTGSYARLAEEIAPRADGHPAPVRRVLGSRSSPCASWPGMRGPASASPFTAGKRRRSGTSVNSARSWATCGIAVRDIAERGRAELRPRQRAANRERGRVYDSPTTNCHRS